MKSGREALLLDPDNREIRLIINASAKKVIERTRQKEKQVLDQLRSLLQIRDLLVDIEDAYVVNASVEARVLCMLLSI